MYTRSWIWFCGVCHQRRPPRKATLRTWKIRSLLKDSCLRSLRPRLRSTLNCSHQLVLHSSALFLVEVPISRMYPRVVESMLHISVFSAVAMWRSYADISFSFTSFLHFSVVPASSPLSQLLCVDTGAIPALYFSKPIRPQPPYIRLCPLIFFLFMNLYISNYNITCNNQYCYIITL